MEEKICGKYRATDEIIIALGDLRNEDLDGIKKHLLAARDFQKIIVNAID